MKKWLAIVASFLLCLYLTAYLVLSARGRYEPAAWGLASVKHYGWAPAGFVHDLQWNSGMMRLFLPLYYLDTRLWHTDENAHSGKYPINEIQPSEPDAGQP